MNKGYFPVFIMVFLTFSGHICFKYFSKSFTVRKNLSANIFQFFNPAFICGSILMAAAPLFYFRALETLDLSSAYSFTAINQITIPAAGILIFREKYSWKKITGIILVSAGIFIWNF